MRAILLILLTVAAFGCSKDQIIDPVGLYNVTTQEGSQTRLGMVTINKFNKDYKIFFDQSSGGYGEVQAKIINGSITIDQKIGNSEYGGTGKVTEDGNLNMDLNIKSWGILYKVKVQGNRAK